jgi:flagellar hook protein FlgE
MGLSSALNSGISGLQSFSNSMSVIGNNLANTNTPGFKASRTLFSDLIPDNVVGTGGITQIGRGATLSTVDNVFSQGSIESTNSNTDLAIEGTGFFIVRNPDSQTNFYTRAGAFRLNEGGDMINPEGYVIQGFERRADGSFSDLVNDIKINTRSFVPAQASSVVSLTTNLNALSEILTWDINSPTESSNFSTTSLMYDSLGSTHLLTTYFTKTDVNTWNYHQTVAAAEIKNVVGNPTNLENTLVEVGRGTFTFDEQGLLSQINGVLKENYGPSWPRVTIDTGSLDWVNGASSTQSIDYVMNLTQFSTDSVVVTQESNGYASGSLSTISIDTEGVITGSYSNGESRILARLALAKFSNNNGLAKIGKNLFEATNASGPPDVGTAGSGVGKVFSYSLEQSTVDIAEEFAKMIITQRSFQANSKTITTTDEMLNEVISLKR